MSDWSSDLSSALAGGNPAAMKAMLARVPVEILQRAVPYLEAMAENSVRAGKLDEALTFYSQLIEVQTDNVEWRTRRAKVLLELEQQSAAMQGLDAAGGALHIELPPAPQLELDPVLFGNPAIDESFDEPMVEGVTQLLRRYSAHQSPRSTLARLEDPAWLAAWDAALATTRDTNVQLYGSELGLLAVRARQHGAKRVIAVEPFPLDERIAGGIVQKNLLLEWRARHGPAIQGWSDDERRTSFEAFADGIRVVAPSDTSLNDTPWNCFAFPNIDHSLLGTGLVQAIRRFKSSSPAERARILPARAQLFAMPIQWTYDSTTFRIEPIRQLRWSLHPQALQDDLNHWKALAAPQPIGVVELENFVARRWERQFSITEAGDIDAVLYWFELDLGAARIGNAPGGPLRCMRPAVQFCDPIPAVPGQRLTIRVTATESRLHIETEPAPRALRSHQLPSWYLPMLLDRERNEAFRSSIGSALLARPAATVLDIGAGCGLLSMMAAAAGAAHVVGCEVSAPMTVIARDIVGLNGFGDEITLVNKDCRQMQLPEDLPKRAEIAVFELFDCSLIGEGVLHFLAHARQHLLAEDARYVPCAARLRAALIEYRLDRLLEADVNLLNPYRFSPAFINVDAATLRHRMLTEPFDVFHFDFSKATPAPEERQLSIPAISDGTVGAVLFWFDLQLDDATWLSNAPTSSQRLHWKQGLQFLPEAHSSAGATLPIIAKHDGSSLTFSWKRDALAKEQLSALPRFDPRWWQVSQELEQQMQSLLQHCRHGPEDYGKVAELAKRIAIDPARHAVAPSIAQRFAMMFFGAWSSRFALTSVTHMPRARC